MTGYKMSSFIWLQGYFRRLWLCVGAPRAAALNTEILHESRESFLAETFFSPTGSRPSHRLFAFHCERAFHHRVLIVVSFAVHEAALLHKSLHSSFNAPVPHPALISCIIYQTIIRAGLFVHWRWLLKPFPSTLRMPWLTISLISSTSASRLKMILRSRILNLQHIAGNLARLIMESSDFRRRDVRRCLRIWKGSCFCIV